MKEDYPPYCWASSLTLMENRYPALIRNRIPTTNAPIKKNEMNNHYRFIILNEACHYWKQTLHIVIFISYCLMNCKIKRWSTFYLSTMIKLFKDRNGQVAIKSVKSMWKCDRPEITPHNMSPHTEVVYQISSGCDL